MIPQLQITLWSPLSQSSLTFPHPHNNTIQVFDLSRKWNATPFVHILRAKAFLKYGVVEEERTHAPHCGPETLQRRVPM